MFWVVYRGLGFWVPIIPAVCLTVVFVAGAALIVGPTHLFDERSGGAIGEKVAYLLAAVSFLLSGVICYFWGVRANRPLPVDSKAGMPKPPSRHSLYFVKMQYWGFPYVAVAAFFFWQWYAAGSPIHTAGHVPLAATVPEAPPAEIVVSPPPADNSSKRPRVDGAEQAKRILKQAQPEYPSLARQARIQGEVRFNAIIGKDGRVRELTLVSGHPLLAPAAEHAVKQWLYRPALLNGEPVEVATQIDVDFSLSR
jgi:TonB family protein